MESIVVGILVLFVFSFLVAVFEAIQQWGPDPPKKRKSNESANKVRTGDGVGKEKHQ